MAAANAAKSQKEPKKQQAQAQQQQEGSEEKPKQQATRRQQASRQTYSVKVINLAWSTTAEGLTQHFADCPVSCNKGCWAVHGGVRGQGRGWCTDGSEGRDAICRLLRVGRIWLRSKSPGRHIVLKLSPGLIFTAEGLTQHTLLTPL
jgi:hypothetical protein